MTLSHELWALIRAMPDTLAGMLADRLDRVVLDAHGPVEMGPGEVACLSHRPPVSWPCPEWAETADRLAARQARRAATGV